MFFIISTFNGAINIWFLYKCSFPDLFFINWVIDILSNHSIIRRRKDDGSIWYTYTNWRLER